MASDTRKRKKPKPSIPHSLFPAEPALNSLPSSKTDIFRLIAVVSVAAAVAVACNLIAASLNQPPTTFCDSNISDSDVSLSEYCEPCPTNGVCYNGKLECGNGYRKHGNLCIEDGDISKAAKKLSKWVEVHACESCAQSLCSGSGKCWVSEYELLNNLDKFKSELDESIYAVAKKKAMDTVHTEMETRRDDRGIEEIKCPESLVNHYKPLNCVIRQWIIQHALLAVPACASFFGCILIASRAYQRHCLSVRAEQLYHESVPPHWPFYSNVDKDAILIELIMIQVCDILEEKPLVSRSVGGEGEPWVVASWLRDHLLSPKERKDPFLWRKVEELVLEDSRVEQYPKLVKGESKVVWEWQVEGPLVSPDKRKRSVGSASAEKSVNLSSNINRWIHAD